MAHSDSSHDSVVDGLVKLYERSPIVRMLVAAYPRSAIGRSWVPCYLQLVEQVARTCFVRSAAFRPAS